MFCFKIWFVVCSVITHSLGKLLQHILSDYHHQAQYRQISQQTRRSKLLSYLVVVVVVVVVVVIVHS